MTPKKAKNKTPEKRVKKDITEGQKMVLTNMLPSGIIDPGLLMGANETDTRNNRNFYNRLSDKGLVEMTPLQKEGRFKNIKRGWLTQDGISVVVNDLLADRCSPIEGGKERKISLRNGMSAENIARLIRISDAQTFLSAAGSQTPYTTIKYGVNPFLFGFPSIDLTEKSNVTVNDLVISAMVDHVRRAEAEGYPLPPISKEFGLVLFLPNNCNPTSKVSIKETRDRGRSGGTHNLRAFNNSVGLLLDFINLNAYVVFRFLDRSSLVWRPKAYNAWLERCAPVLKTFGFENLDYAGHPKDAIMLCDTPGEICNRAANMDKMREPFTRVLPILLRQEGLAVISSILDLGIAEYENAVSREAAAQLPGTQWVQSPQSIARLKYHGEPLYVGTQIDFAKMARLKELLGANPQLHPYVACLDWQKELYEKHIGIPKEFILEILSCEE